MESLTSNSSSEVISSFPDDSMHIFFEFVLHGVVLNLVGLVSWDRLEKVRIR